MHEKSRGRSLGIHHMRILEDIGDFDFGLVVLRGGAGHFGGRGVIVMIQGERRMSAVFGIAVGNQGLLILSISSSKNTSICGSNLFYVKRCCLSSKQG